MWITQNFLSFQKQHSFTRDLSKVVSFATEKQSQMLYGANILLYWGVAILNRSRIRIKFYIKSIASDISLKFFVALCANRPMTAWQKRKNVIQQKREQKFAMIATDQRCSNGSWSERNCKLPAARRRTQNRCCWTPGSVRRSRSGSWFPPIARPSLCEEEQKNNHRCETARK